MASGRFSISSSVTSFDNDGTISVNVSLVPPTTIKKGSKTYAQFDYNCLEVNYSDLDESTVRANTKGSRNYIMVTAGLFIEYNNRYYCVQKNKNSGWKILTSSEMSSAGLSAGATDSNGYTQYWYVRTDNIKDLPFTFTVPKYIAQGEKLYVAVSGDYDIDMYYNDGAERFYGTEIGESHPWGDDYSHSSFSGFADYCEIRSCQRSYTMGSVSISYPTFCTSDKVIITTPSVYNAYRMVLQRSLDNGSTWSDIYTNSTASSLDDPCTWTIEYDNRLLSSGSGTRSLTATLNAAPPIPAITYTDNDRTSTAIYRVVYYGKTTVTETGTVASEVLDLTTTTPTEIYRVSEYSNREVDTLTVTNTSVSDISRLSFRELFVSTSLPNTSFSLGGSSSGNSLTHNLSSLDGNNSLTTNLGNYFNLPNGTYEYRIYPALDGVENYVNTDGNNYISIFYEKATSSLEMIRPIEMGSLMPETIKLLINPSKENIPAGSTFSIYVSNNGNDETPVWEELPKQCIGSTSNPDVDTYMFTNETKTAETWKLLIKVVAEKGTATSDFYLTYISAVINGGEQHESGYDKLDYIQLDSTATAIDISIPSGYTRYKILCSIIPTATGGYPVFKVNDLTTGYNTIQLKSNNSSYANLTKSTSNGNAGYAGNSPTANVLMFVEIDIAYDVYKNIYQIVSRGHAQTGVTFTHSYITLDTGLSKFTIFSADAAYPFAIGSSVTLLGVK